MIIEEKRSPNSKRRKEKNKKEKEKITRQPGGNHPHSAADADQYGLPIQTFEKATLFSITNPTTITPRTTLELYHRTLSQSQSPSSVPNQSINRNQNKNHYSPQLFTHPQMKGWLSALFKFLKMLKRTAINRLKRWSEWNAQKERVAEGRLYVFCWYLGGRLERGKEREKSSQQERAWIGLVGWGNWEEVSLVDDGRLRW